MNEAIADGQLQAILLEINPNTNISVLGPIDTSVGPGDSDSTFPGASGEGQGDPPADGSERQSESNLSPGGKAGIAIAAVGVTAAVVAAILMTRKRPRDDDGASLDSSDEDVSRRSTQSASVRRLMAAAEAAGSTDQPGVYPDEYHQGASGHITSSTQNPMAEGEERGVGEDEYYEGEGEGGYYEDEGEYNEEGAQGDFSEEQPSGAPGSFPTSYAAPGPEDTPSTPLLPAAAAAGAAALGAQHEILENPTDDSGILYEDDAAMADSYDDALDAQIMESAAKIKEGAAVDDILQALPGDAHSTESHDSSFEDDIRAAITSMEGEGDGEGGPRAVSPERDIPDGVDDPSPAPEEPPAPSSVDASDSEDRGKPEDKSGVAGLIRKFSSKNVQAN